MNSKLLLFFLIYKNVLFLRLSLVKTKKQTSFKKRYTKIKTFESIKKYPFSVAIISRSRFRFEFTYFRLLKRWFKKLLTYKFRKTLQPKIWFNLVSNYPLTKKSKNSRMGKGKGSFFRWAILVPSNYVLFEFFNADRSRVRIIAKKWNYTLSRKNVVIM